MDWTKPGERPRACDIGWKHLDAQWNEAVNDIIARLREGVEERDWYRVERLAVQLQQQDNMRAFDAIDLMNFEFDRREAERANPPARYGGRIPRHTPAA